MSLEEFPRFEYIWTRMKEIASEPGRHFKTIGGRTSFTTQVYSNRIEIDSLSAKTLHHITQDSAFANYQIFIKLPKEERYNTSNYTQTWDKVYVLPFFREILKKEIKE